MIGVCEGRAAVGEVLADGVGIGVRGEEPTVVFVSPGEGAGVVAGGDTDVNVIAPEFHIAAKFEELISTSIGIRLGLAGWRGNVICLPLINSCAD